jgi:hypothetical protein
VTTKRWRVRIDDETYDVEARASMWTGGVRVLVNGTELPRRASPRDKARRVIFSLGRHVATLVWITYGRGSTRYDLVLDGRSITTGGQPRPPRNPDESLATSWLLLIASAAFLCGVLWFGALPEIRLASEGRETAGQVTGRHTESGRSTSYYLHYTFAAADGIARAAQGRVSYDTYRTARLGDPIAVVYVASTPDIQRPASFDERIWILLLVAMFGVILLFALSMVWRAQRLRSITAALANRAVRTTATVDKVSKEFGGQAFRIEYRYEDADGRAHKGRTPRLYAEEAAAYAPGSSATIAYDPNDPGNNMWIGTADPNATIWVTAAGT